MTDPKQIPHLINLLDDDSPEVTQRVMKELVSFGPNLATELKDRRPKLNERQERLVRHILESQKKVWIRKVWPSWMRLDQDHEKLEKAMAILGEFLAPLDTNERLSSLLDDLAESYRTRFATNDPRQLALFLFKEKGFKGNEKDFYNAQNSNLIYVINQRRGIPISLVSVYMLVGQRLGIKVEGCNFPGHFLARVPWKGHHLFVDCFNDGQFIRKKDILQVRQYNNRHMEAILDEPCSCEMIIKRVLANLIRAYQMSGDAANHRLMIELFKGLEERMMRQKFKDMRPEDIIANKRPKFHSGQIVRHNRYGYRGVIVSIDQSCQATDSWYYGNQTQPARQQPWYHVLMHGTEQVTYVAEGNLRPDESRDKIEHPLLTYFFNRSDDGTYIRNKNEWPETDF